MITYPKQDEKFTIDDFRIDNSEKCANYYIHVVNDETGVCKRIFEHYSFPYVLAKYEDFKREVADGWHIEITVGIPQGEVRARLM